MMKIKSITGVLLLILISLQVRAEWFINREHKCKINIPANWSSNSYQDGTDKVYDFYSPDENIAIQLRSFKASAGVTMDVLIDVYEQNMLPTGNQRTGLFDKVSKNGIPGKQGVYTAMYNGTPVTMSTFYAVPNNYGYVLLIIVPTNMLEQKSNEIKAITKTFFVDGFFATDATVQKLPAKQPTKASGGLGGLKGSTSGGNTKSAEENFVTISGPKVNGTFHFEKSGSYPNKYNGTVVIRGLDKSGTNALEIALSKRKGKGSYEYGVGPDGPPKFNIRAIDGKGLGGSYSGTGELIITEYKEGGMIKGHFTANTNGHDVKGSFYLPLSTPKGYGGY